MEIPGKRVPATHYSVVDSLYSGGPRLDILYKQWAVLGRAGSKAKRARDKKEASLQLYNRTRCNSKRQQNEELFRKYSCPNVCVVHYTLLKVIYLSQSIVIRSTIFASTQRHISVAIHYDAVRLFRIAFGSRQNLASDCRRRRSASQLVR